MRNRKNYQSAQSPDVNACDLGINKYLADAVEATGPTDKNSLRKLSTRPGGIC